MEANTLLPNIDHVVVLMLENRSFDNVLGGLYPAGASFEGLTGKEWNYNPTAPGVGTWTVWQASPGTASGTIPFPDPGEAFTDMNTQLFGGPSPGNCPSPSMGGFAANYARQPPSREGIDQPSVPPIPLNIMQYFDEGNVPWSYALARHYAVSDAWHAAAPVQTISNRTLTHTGTPSMMPGTNRSRVNNGDYTSGLSFSKIVEGRFDPPVTDTTVFEMLDEAYPSGRAGACRDLAQKEGRLNWKVYYHDAPLSVLCRYVYQHWCLDSLYGGNVFRYHEHFGAETNFEYDVRNGILPTYSFIEPAYTGVEYTANSNHPGGAIPDPLDLNAQNFPPPINVHEGEKLLAEVYASLARYPSVFERTLLIVTYDEHGGTYDHVKPGSAVSPFTRPTSNFNYDRCGVRVPAILINPRLTTKVFRPTDGVSMKDACGAFVTRLDHTSIIRSLCQRFGLGTPPTPRAASVPTLAGLIRATAAAPHVPERSVIAAAERSMAEKLSLPRDPGKAARIRDWFARRERDDFPGDHLNNAIFATYALSWHGRERAGSYPLREIVDLDGDDAVALNAIDIRDTATLLEACREPGGPARLAGIAQREESRVLRWAQQAELMQKPGIVGDDAFLLMTAGVTGIADLKLRDASELQAKLVSAAAALGIVDFAQNPAVTRKWIAP